MERAYVTSRCPLREIHRKLPAEKLALVPGYYVNEASRIMTWFEIAGIDRLTREEMNKIVVQSSGRSIMSVINSSAVLFRVRAGV